MTRSLGKTQEEVLRVTEILNKQVQIGGSTAKEAQAGLLQFGQALASGVLQGEELRSVMENLIGVQQGLIIGFQNLRREGRIDLDVNQSNIRDYAREGILTSELLFEAILASADDTEAKFGDIAVTFQQALSQLRSGLTSFGGEVLLQLGIVDQAGYTGRGEPY